MYIQDERQITRQYIFATSFSFLLEIIYNSSLIFSVASERPYLKAAGVTSFILTLANSLSFSLMLSGINFFGTAEQIQTLVILLSPLPSFFLVMNFILEKRTCPEEREKKSLAAYIGFSLIVMIMSVSIIIKLIINHKDLLQHPNYGISKEEIESAEIFEAHIFVTKGGDSLRYRLMKPLDSVGQSFPLLIDLHGSSARGSDNFKQVSSVMIGTLLSKDNNRVKFPAFIVMPQCPVNLTWGGVQGKGSLDSKLIELVFDLEKKYAIDTTRRYLSGNSMGGHGVWHLIAKYPNFFAAAIPISGEGNPDNGIKISTIPLWAFHGERDKTVPVSGSSEIIKAMRQNGGQPLYTECKGLGHDIRKEIVTTPQLLHWLFSQRKQTKVY